MPIGFYLVCTSCAWFITAVTVHLILLFAYGKVGMNVSKSARNHLQIPEVWKLLYLWIWACTLHWVVSGWHLLLSGEHRFQKRILFTICNEGKAMEDHPSTRRPIRRILGTTDLSAWPWCRLRLWSDSSRVRSPGMWRTTRGSGPDSMGSWKAGPA